MSTKLNAEELAAQYIPDWSESDFTTKRRGFAMCVEKFAQPIADERDELREALEWYEDQAAALVRNKGNDDAMLAIMHALLIDGGNRARTILAKYPRTDDAK